MEKTINKNEGQKRFMEGFLNPQREYTPIPFWFLNDTLTKEKLIRQIHDFNEKGVNGFVIHPRIGVPKEMVYLSDEFMDMVTVMVEEAKKLSMKVVLYDEAMYPSGSAHGMVVKNHPEYASIGLKKLEARGVSPSLHLTAQEKEDLLAAMAVRITSEGYDLSSLMLFDPKETAFGVTSDGEEEWAVFVFLEKFTGGHIRGIHFGEDDGEGNEPPSADLLNPKAVEEFIQLTHERYFDVLKEHFGDTVIGMFTDEPDIMGRDHEPGLLAWTRGFLTFAGDFGLEEKELFLLWENTSDKSPLKGKVREAAIAAGKKYKTAVNKRMEETYYEPLSVWCKTHGIALTGHPHESDDIGFMKYFQMPAQDVVWRWVAPEKNLGIEGPHSTMAKCTSDSARHRGIKRNGNECFACCGENGIEWSFTVRDMKWYMDWLFVRGVNLLFPHAFFYSVEGERRFGERPPDVGPNNTWWPFYNQISDYMKRMSYLLTEFTNSASVAVLCEAHNLPWKAAKMLFENQIEFNYLEEELCSEPECKVQNGKLIVRDQAYSVVVIEDADRYYTCKDILEKFVKEGGNLVVLDSELAIRMPGVRAWIAENENAFITQMRSFGAERVRSKKHTKSLRVTHGFKESNEFFLLTNEGNEKINTTLLFPFTGTIECLDAWRGTRQKAAVKVRQTQNGLNSLTDHTGLFASLSKFMELPLILNERESLILLVDRDEIPDMPEMEEAEYTTDQTGNKISYCSLVTKFPDQIWTMTTQDGKVIKTDGVQLWNEILGLEEYSGRMTYETEFCYDDEITGSESLSIDKVHEFAKATLNGTDLGMILWEPFEYDTKGALKRGKNHLTVEVYNTPANHYSKKALPSGIENGISIVKNKNK